MRTSRLVSVLACLSALGACGSSTSTFVIAVGARGPLPAWAGPCDTAGVEGDGARVDARGYVAERAGDVTLSCRHGRLRLSVRRAIRLAIEGPEVTMRFAPYRLVAYDDSGERLDLAGADAQWTIPASVERGPACHGDMLPSCDPPSVTRLRRVDDGDVTVSATALGLRASRTF